MDGMAFIKENHIFLNQQLQTQEDVFHFLAKKSTELEVAQDAQEVFDKLNEREQEGTTGMMNGFAIPQQKQQRFNKRPLSSLPWTKVLSGRALTTN